MNRVLIAVAVLFLSSAPVAVRAQSGTPARLSFADRVQLLDCEPAGPAPCFRLKLNVVDAHGDPAAAELVPPSELSKNTNILLAGQQLRPFYVEAQNATTAVRGRVALVLVDISGSMNNTMSPGQSRFDAAKVALKEFLNHFQDGIDEVAIVPFESHNVVQTVKAARFSNARGDALLQVDELPAPAPRNNTALYSAVDAGLDTLTAHTRSANAGGPDREVMLIVMTDGKNEVFKNDDPGLLEGPQGLEAVAGKVRSSGVEVIGIGFGDAAGIDRNALEQLSKQVFMAPDAETLARSFRVARKLLNSRITVTFNSKAWPDRASLAGHTLPVLANMTLASGANISSPETTWEAPAMGMPVFNGKCTDQEREALFRVSDPIGFDWFGVLTPILVFAGILLLLVLLWFWVPRFIWPDQYSGLHEELQRWQAPPSRGGKGERAPAGFSSTGQHVPAHARAPGDPTVLQSRTDMTKSRLE